MKTLLKWMLVCSFFLFMIGCEDDEPVLPTCDETVDNLNFNQYQVLGSHNSYRQIITPEIYQFMLSVPEMLPDDFDPKSWDYGHEPLEDQLGVYNVRSIELDVYRDPDGGLFYVRKGNAMVGLDPVSYEDDLLNPGLKVLHFPDFDYNTHFLTFRESLMAVQDWSNNHPEHLPIIVLVEAKEDSPDLMLPGLGLTASLPFIDGSVDEIEQEISDVFAGDFDHLIVPDDVRGSYSSLREAVTQNNWPKLKDLKGKLLFVLMARDGVISDYISSAPSLESRNMFVFRDEDQTDGAESAFIKIDDPVTEYARIQELVQEGFIVRTRADADTYEARDADYNRMMKAFLSGAQIVSTDYYRADPRYMNSDEWTMYHAHFPNYELAIFNNQTYNESEISCEITE